jgi:hypothetical protein
VKSYRLCTYCGLNLDDIEDNSTVQPNGSSSGQVALRKNFKPHIALKHTVQVCEDRGLDFYNEEGLVTFPAFLSQVHIVATTISSLQAHSYTVMPACKFFEIT